MIGRYVAYSDYKDSGLEWLGVIPSEWEVKRLGQFLFERREKCSDKDYEALSVTKNGIVPQLDTAAKTDAGDNRKRVHKGDFVINSRSDRKGSSGLSSFNGSVSLISIVLEPVAIHGEFVHHLLRSYPFQEEFYRFGKGIVADLWSTNYSEMKNICLPIPSLEEQRTIAAFLDYETARIDQLIAKQQRLIELLKEKRQAVISHAVNIREGEKSAKLSYFVDLLPGYAFPSASFKNESDGNIPLLRGVNVGVGKLKWNDTVWWPQADRVIVKDFELQVGDIVFGMDRPWIAAGARVAEVTSADLPCLLLQRVARIRTHLNTYQPFVKLCLSSYEFKSFVEADLTGVSVPHISPDQIKSFPIRAIGFEIQKVETESALRLCHVLETIEAKALQAIELMQERRTALISAAVTGKIDLRDWTPPKEG
ncbi:restriction endonuclease subunit S [Shewanella baltica]|uniref:restriction endonuclease subunit S n=1 Tax=Shewanella baltica TaxID=62322 RepID=UPI0039B0B949